MASRFGVCLLALQGSRGDDAAAIMGDDDGPAKRTLKRVTAQDAAAADRLFSVLMGDNVAPRKDFILTNAEDLQREDLDI